MTEKTRGDKFPLLIYRRWAKMLRLPSLLIAITSLPVWWYAPDHPLLIGRWWIFLVISIVGALIFVYSLFVRQAAYVQCLPNYVKLTTPFLPVAISYRRIVQARPVEFHSQLSEADVKRTRRRLLEPFLGRTVLLLEVKGYPVSEKRLRRYLPWYMFATEATGFVLVTEDWMALSRQISVFSDRWIARRQTPQRRSIGPMF